MTEEEKKERARQYNKQYREKNKERLAAQKREWYEKNREAVCAKQAVYRENNREQIEQYRERTRESKNARNREYMKGYYAKNKESIKAYQKAYYQENADKVKERTANWKKENKVRVDAVNKMYRAEHGKEHAEYIKKRRHEDPTYKMVCSVRNMLNNAFNKRMKIKKKQQAEEILGCSIEFFIGYLQSQFQEGMTLENHGAWHIDHIIPLASAKSEADVVKLNHYTNLRPLWATDNLKRPRRTP